MNSIIESSNNGNTLSDKSQKPQISSNVNPITNNEISEKSKETPYGTLNNGRLIFNDELYNKFDDEVSWEIFSQGFIEFVKQNNITIIVTKYNVGWNRLVGTLQSASGINHPIELEIEYINFNGLIKYQRININHENSLKNKSNSSNTIKETPFGTLINGILYLNISWCVRSVYTIINFINDNNVTEIHINPLLDGSSVIVYNDFKNALLRYNKQFRNPVKIVESTIIYLQQ